MRKVCFVNFGANFALIADSSFVAYKAKDNLLSDNYVLGFPPEYHTLRVERRNATPLCNENNSSPQVADRHRSHQVRFQEQGLDVNLAFLNHLCCSQRSPIPCTDTYKNIRYTLLTRLLAEAASTGPSERTRIFLQIYRYIFEKYLNMENAEVYHKNNGVQKRDAMQCLKEYAQKIKWKKDGNTVLDIGSGDGSVTINILTKFLPSNCTTVVGSDKSERMLQFANRHYATNLFNFIILDIEGDLPDDLRGKFDLVFSNYALNWVTQQEVAFKNIYNLMKSGGTCLLIIIGHVPVFTIYRTLARQEKWNYWMRDVERFVSPYHDCQDPEKVIKKMMTSIGFINIDVRCTEKSYTFIGVDAIKNFIAGINPFKIPQDMMEDFQEDYLKTIKDLKLMDYVHYNEEGSVKTRQNYRLITIFAEK